MGIDSINSVAVVLIEKKTDGGLQQIDERQWSKEMVEALHHVNYLTLGGREFETIEGRLNVDTGKLELLVVPVTIR